MRTPSLIAAAVLSCGLAFAGHSENVVYTDGNLAGINPQTSAVLDLSQDKAMKLRVGRTDVSVPYASITGTNAPAAEPAAKSGKKGAKPVQAVMVQFNSAQGEARTMTLQLSKPAASHVLATIHKHTPATTQIASVQPLASLQPARPDKTAAPGASAPSDSSSASAAAPPNAAASDTKKKSKDKVAKKNKKDKKSKEEEEKQEASNKPKKTWTCGPDLPADCAREDWWGDSTWKTNRNSAKWEQPSATAAAQ